MATTSIYDKGFFERIQRGSELSAMTIVPLVLELTRPASVVDVGCGTGEFLHIFHEHGVDEILGIDGNYVNRSQLAIPQECFKALDLSMPFTLTRKFDLAISLEVGEHLASDRAADFIESLTQLAPIILFSAAIPLQDGYHHINEQWLEYWAQLFSAKGFVPVDALRKRIWNNRQVEDYYRQNAIFFCTEQTLANNETLQKEFQSTNPDMLSMVHPELFLRKCNAVPMRALRPIKNKARVLLRK